MALSRRTFLSANATVLAGIGIGSVPPAPETAGESPAGVVPAPQAAGGAHGPEAAGDLALFRPVTASSTAYAATPAEFAVDGLYETGVRGSGWRAATRTDPQWIAVDLQAECRVEAVVLTFEAKPGDPEWTTGGASDVNHWAGTTGFEVLSSYPTAFDIAVSRDGTTWTTVHRTADGTGAVTRIVLDEPVTARWVRLTGTSRSTTNPLGLNGLQVLGTSTSARPPATGWTDWGVHDEPAPALRVAADGTVPLESGWTLTYDSRVGPATGDTLSAVGVDTSRWLPATVPGTVLASLVERGHLPDPVRGFGNLLIPETLSRHSWWYRRQFTVPRGLRTDADARVWLEFDGINHHAEIWLDGVRIGELTHPYARARFDVTAQLAKAQVTAAQAAASRGEHALAVRIDPMPFPGNPGDKGPDGWAYTDAGSDTMNRNSPTYLAVSGWDWMPAVRDRVSGIWNHVRLRSTGPVLVGDPGVRTVLDSGNAHVTVSVPVRNSSSEARSVTVRATLDDLRLAATVTVPAGQEHEVVFPAATIREPQLWWPNGYGEPALHDLRVRVETGGRASDDRTVRVGLRQVEYETTPGLTVPPGGSASKTTSFDRRTGRYVRIACDTRATGWGSSMYTLTVADSARPDVDLALHRPATASSQDNADNGPGNAVDGLAGTRWSSDYSDGQWIQVDLGAGTTFDTVTIVWETAFAASLRILVSDDGTDFREAASVSNAATPLKFVVNGVPVFARGGSWGWDELLRRALPDRLPAAVRLHRDLGFTMIRAWIGSVNREELYALCDAAGIMVWNEFPSAWLLDPPDHTTYLDQAHDTVLRYRSHPSLVLWCAKNEGDPSAEIDAALRTSVTALTDTYYLSNSIAGPISGDGGYSYQTPAQYFGGTRFGFHSEIGMPTVPVEESMRDLLGGTPGWPIGGAWYLHDWCVNGGQDVTTYKQAIDARLGESSSLGEFCRKAQFVNYESMRALFEAWNARLWNDATGVLLWMSHPAHHSTVWQVYDYDLDVNGTYYGARTASEMVHVQANQPGWDVVVVNHTASALPAATVTAELLDLDGKPLAPVHRATVTAAASSVTPAFTPAALPGVHLLRLTLTTAAGRVVSRNVYWRYQNPSDLRALNAVRPTTLRLSTTAHGDRLTARVTNTGPTVAMMVRLSLRDRHTGDRVLPAVYGDNYLWLLPGETRTIDVTGPADHPLARLTVTVEGYNVRQ